MSLPMMQSCMLNVDNFTTVHKIKMKGTKCLEDGFRTGVVEHTS